MQRKGLDFFYRALDTSLPLGSSGVHLEFGSLDPWFPRTVCGRRQLLASSNVHSRGSEDRMKEGAAGNSSHFVVRRVRHRYRSICRCMAQVGCPAHCDRAVEM